MPQPAQSLEFPEWPEARAPGQERHERSPGAAKSAPSDAMRKCGAPSAGRHTAPPTWSQPGERRRLP
eukprot:14799935-Alexandrium_andersonii.AAC.1